MYEKQENDIKTLMIEKNQQEELGISTNSYQKKLKNKNDSCEN